MKSLIDTGHERRLWLDRSMEKTAILAAFKSTFSNSIRLLVSCVDYWIRLALFEQLLVVGFAYVLPHLLVY